MAIKAKRADYARVHHGQSDPAERLMRLDDTVGWGRNTIERYVMVGKGLSAETAGSSRADDLKRNEGDELRIVSRSAAVRRSASLGTE